MNARKLLIAASFAVALLFIGWLKWGTGNEHSPETPEEQRRMDTSITNPAADLGTKEGTRTVAPVGETGIPVELIQSAGDDPDTRENRESRRCYSGRGYGAVIDTEGMVLVTGTEEWPVMDANRNAAGSHFLVHHGDGRYAVYDTAGKKHGDIPSLENTPGQSAITWHWKDNTTLIGTASWSTPRKPNSGADTDILPESVALYLYPLNTGTGLQRIALPPASAGTFIRIEKITSEGHVVLSEAVAENYHGGKANTVLGVFKIAPASE